MAYTTTVSPNDVITIYVNTVTIDIFLGYRLTSIKTRLFSEGKVIPISIEKPLFGRIQTVVIPKVPISTQELLDYILLVFQEELYDVTTWISDYNIQTSIEYKEEKEKEELPWYQPSGTPIEWLTGITPTHLIVIALGLGAIYFYTKKR